MGAVLRLSCSNAGVASRLGLMIRSKAASVGGLFHANREPFPIVMELRPEKPLFVATIEQAK